MYCVGVSFKRGSTVCAITTPSGKQKAAFLVIQVHNLTPQSDLTTLPIN